MNTGFRGPLGIFAQDANRFYRRHCWQTTFKIIKKVHFFTVILHVIFHFQMWKLIINIEEKIK